MRAILIVAGAALTIAGCSGGNSDNNGVDTLAVNNLVVDDGTGNGMMTGDMNAMTGDMNNMSAADTANAMDQDLTHNDADTNLANGI